MVVGAFLFVHHGVVLQTRAKTPATNLPKINHHARNQGGTVEPIMEGTMDATLEQQVRLRAYELWLCEGMTHGRDWDHWYTAECELHIERAAAAMTAPQTKRRTRRAKAKK
jgi:hypothetical protein